MKSYEELIGKHEGENAFVLGAGGSLWRNMHNSLFTYLKEYGTVITVNSAIMAEPEPHYFISNDHLVTRWSWWKDFVLKSKCIKIVRDSWLRYKDEIENFYIFSPRKTSENEINFEDSGLCYPSSIPTSIDFAIKCGVKNIFLLGVDQCLDEKTGFHHFWQFFPENKKPKQIKPAQSNWKEQQKVFVYNNMSYKALKKFAEYKGSKIYNVSYMATEKNNGWMTEVDIFEIISLNQVEKIIK